MYPPAPLPALPAGNAIPAATAIPPRNPSIPFTLRWECPGEPLDGFATTGIESSTDLVTWHREVALPLTIYSNVWIDPYPAAGMKFYRAFKE